MRKTLKRTVRQYTAVFESDPDIGGYTVTIPALPGCISEGDTFEAALKNIQEAARLYLEVMSEKGKSIARQGRNVILAPIQVPV
jgi:predicted RNase H-like HicB family nuclease